MCLSHRSLHGTTVKEASLHNEALEGSRTSYTTRNGVAMYADELQSGTSYDYENRLTSLSGGCAYTYAPTGERVNDTCQTGHVSLYDSASGGSSNLVAQYNTTGGLQAWYLQVDSLDTPIRMVTPSGTYAYAVDGPGSLDRLTDTGGATVETYTYDPWGLTSASGSVTNPFQFTGRTLEPSGLYDYRARSYDPSENGAHRFLSQDPAGGGYAYVGDSPANFVDPTGMKACDAQGRCWYHNAPPASPPSAGPPSAQSGPVWTDSCTFSLVMFIVAAAFAWMGLMVDQGLAQAVWMAHTSWAAGAAWEAATHSVWTMINLLISIGWFVISNLPWWQSFVAGASFASDVIPLALAARAVVFGIQLGIFLVGLHANNCI